LATAAAFDLVLGGAGDAGQLQTATVANTAIQARAKVFTQNTPMPVSEAQPKHLAMNSMQNGNH